MAGHVAMMAAGENVVHVAMAIVSKENARVRVPRIVNANPVVPMAVAEHAAAVKETAFATTVHAWMSPSWGWIPTSNCLRSMGAARGDHPQRHSPRLHSYWSALHFWLSD